MYNKRDTDYSSIIKQYLNKYRDEFHGEENVRRQELKKQYYNEVETFGV